MVQETFAILIIRKLLSTTFPAPTYLLTKFWIPLQILLQSNPLLKLKIIVSSNCSILSISIDWLLCVSYISFRDHGFKVRVLKFSI